LVSKQLTSCIFNSRLSHYHIAAFAGEHQSCVSSFGSTCNLPYENFNADMYCRTRAFRLKSVVFRNKQQATNTLLPSSLGRLIAFLLIFISHFALENVSKAAAEPVQLLSNSLQLSNRCYGARGLHCVSYHLQPYIKVVAPRTHSKTCPNGCSGKGVCNADTGQCDCPAGEVLHPASDWLDAADMHHQNTILC